MRLLEEIRSCTLCSNNLPMEPKPILQFCKRAKILIIGQAPGLKAHESGIPWNDASGVRLREWLGICEEVFYDKETVAIIPMGFCYPGRGKTGDLPPRKECSARWHDCLLAELKNLQMVILVGQYASHYFLGEGTIKDKILSLKKEGHFLVLPHPSPRNNIWLAKNKWFERQIVPALKKRVAQCLEQS